MTERAKSATSPSMSPTAPPPASPEPTGQGSSPGTSGVDPHGAIRTLRHDVTDRPFIVIWEVTRACALACAHCRADAMVHRDPRELTTAEGLALLDDLAALGAPRPIVVLTGGDPFERPDLVQLVDHGTSIGLPVALAPSVTPRLTPQILSELRQAGASTVSLSIDGASAATHDAFRGFDGVYAETLAAAAAVRDAGLRLQINTTVTKGTARELPAILETVIDQRAALWSVFFLVPTGRGENLQPLDALEVEDVLVWLGAVADRVPVKATEAPQFRRVVIERARAGGADPADYDPGPLGRDLRAATPPPRQPQPKSSAPSAGSPEGARRGVPEAHPPAAPASAAPAGRIRPPLDVNAGRGFAFIDHTGEVYPSGFLPLSAGSIREAPFTEIYRSSPLLKSLRDPAQLKGRCGRCDFAEVCGGSRSHAYAVTGDALAEDPSCAYQPPASGEAPLDQG